MRRVGLVLGFAALLPRRQLCEIGAWRSGKKGETDVIIEGAIT